MAGIPGSDTRVAVHIMVLGRVQGVGFRSWTAGQARALRVSGWVRNNDDGSVEIVAEGTEPSVNAFTETVRSGNSYSHVDDIKINRVRPSGYTRFDIEY